MGSSSPVSRVVHYRGRSDTGTVDASPTWIAAEDTSFSVTVGTAFRIRIAVENTGTASDTITAPDTTRGIKRCGYADNTYGNLANLINSADAGSSADATDVTVQRLTSGTGSFATGTAGYDENETLSCAVANGNFTEVELGVVLTGGSASIGVGGGETWTFNLGGLTNAALNLPTFTTPDTNGSDFQHGNQLGGAAQQVANSANISMTTAAAARNGNLVVVHVACDNAGTADGDNSDISGVTFNGVAMTKGKEQTNGEGAAQAGVTSSLWWLQISGGDVAAGATVTATFTTSTTSGDANAIQAREFIVASGKTVSVEATGGTVADAAALPASTDAVTSNIECLRVAGHACENAYAVGTGTTEMPQILDATNKDWSFWWTSGKLMRCSAEAISAANVTSCVEANISTGTGKASQPNFSGSTRDWASAYVAFRADVGADFEDGAGAGTGQSTASGGFLATASFAGAGTGQSTASGGFLADAAFAGAAAATATATGGGDGQTSLVGAAAGDAQASAALRADAAFAGAAAATATASAGLLADAAFAGTAARGDAQASAVIEGTTALVGAAAGDAQASAAGVDASSGTSDAAGAAAATATAAAVIEGTTALIGAAAGASTATGALRAEADFAGAAAGTATASGTITALVDGDGAVAGTATASASLAAFFDALGLMGGSASASAIIVQGFSGKTSGTTLTRPRSGTVHDKRTSGTDITRPRTDTVISGMRSRTALTRGRSETILG